MATLQTQADNPLAALPPAGKLLGLDLGTKTIGVATSDGLRYSATPLETIARTKFTADAERLKTLITQNAAVGIVLGLPLNMDGSEGPRAQSTRAFARNLAKLVDIPIAFWDERLSTSAVTRTLIEADIRRNKRAQVVDKLAASYILQGALDRLKSHNCPGNVRELENLIRRICALYAEDLITARIIERELADHSPARPGQEGPPTLATLVERHLQSYFASQPEGTPPAGLYDRVVEEVEAPLIRLTLNATRGNQVRAAEILGLNRNTLRKKITDLGIEGVRARR